MLGKRTRFLTMLAAAVGVPYAWFNENLALPVRNSWNSLKAEYAARSTPATDFTGIDTPGGAMSGLHYSGTAFPPQDAAGPEMPIVAPSGRENPRAGAQGRILLPGENSPPSVPHLAPAGGDPLRFVPVSAPGTPGTARSSAAPYTLEEVLRCDVTPRWVMDRWPRISTVHAQPDLEGLRVTLVTGTTPADFLGSLTYYFDRQQKVRRITLHGHMGDDRALVALAAQRFGMRPEATLSAGIHVTRWNGRPVNVLRVSHSPVIRASTPHSRLLVELEINDPGAGHGLSHELRQLLEYETHVRRWGD